MVAFVKFLTAAAFKGITLSADIVFATSTPLTVAIPGYIISKRLKIPMVFEVRDLWPELPVAMGVIKNQILVKILRLLEWLSYHSSIGCIGLSPGICDGIIKRGVSPNNVELIPNFCDETIFKPLKNV